jgi:hypothetical protein
VAVGATDSRKIRRVAFLSMGGAMRWLLITCVAFGLLTAGCRSIDEEPNHSGPPAFQGIHIP